MTAGRASVAVRVDASMEIGIGHAMRCIALAEGLQRIGATICFLSRKMPEFLVDSIRSRGFGIENLSGGMPGAPDGLAHFKWLETSQQTDAEHSAMALSDRQCDWLVVDHYALDRRWESAMRRVTPRLLAIDDLADRDHDCDVVVDQNLFPAMQERYRSRVSDRCRLLTGPDYALLREEFGIARASLRTRDGNVDRLLILMGGADVDDFTTKAVNAASRIASLRVDVVISEQHPAAESISRACTRFGYTLHRHPSNIARLMSDADLAIGAGGISNWERCCLGLPGIVVSIAANQDAIAETLNETGAIFYMGSADAVTPDALALKMEQLMAQPELVSDAAGKGMMLVDGMGVARISNLMYSML